MQVKTIESALEDLDERMHEQDHRMPYGLFSFDRNGVRMTIAALEDETGELYHEWSHHKNNLGNALDSIRHEYLDIAAVAMRGYLETFTGR